jgi:hypothetical protein
MTSRTTWDKLPTPRAPQPLITLAVVATLILIVTGVMAACGETGSGDAGGYQIPHPTGPNELVLRVETGGGFVPVEYSLTALPEISIYGDGRVIVTGPVIAIYPGPALPNLQTAVVSEQTLQAILDAAKEAGLFQNGVDYGRPNITDVGTTKFTINADNATFITDVYALGMEEGTSGLSMEQQQRRAALDELRGRLVDITTFAEEELTWEPYQFTALTVHSIVADPSATADPDVEPNRLRWPLSDLATAGEAVQPEGYRRAVIAGDDLEALRPLLANATQITLWESAGVQYHLLFRPLLPDETLQPPSTG